MLDGNFMVLGMATAIFNLQPNNNMTKGQNAAVDYIQHFLKSDRTTFSWSDLMDAVKHKAKVRNWMTIRDILQFAINREYIKRSDDIHVEKYVKL